MFGHTGHRRDRLRSQPFPTPWLAILRDNVPYHQRLGPADQLHLQGDIQILIAEKHFEACGDLQMSDEIKITVAACASILLLHVENHDYYPRLRSVLICPHAYMVHAVRRRVGALLVESDEARAGESWPAGPVVIAWDHVPHRGCAVTPGRNVALHEFAHQLDQERGPANGAPVLPDPAMYEAWARTLGKEYQGLRDAAGAARPTLLDPYGATNPAEFFAVATECFFERALQLQQQLPELYNELKLYYRQDPAA